MGYSFKLLEYKTDGKLVETLGSEGGHKLDGRLGRNRAVDDAYAYYARIKHVRGYLVGFNLYKDGHLVRAYLIDTN